MKAKFGAILLIASVEAVRVNSMYDHWTVERFDNSNATTWIESSPMAAYGRSELENTFVQLRKPYDHWT